MGFLLLFSRNLCKAPKQLLDFMSELKKDNVILKCLTVEGFADAYFNKVDFVLNNYSPYFTTYKDILFVPTAKDKIFYLEEYAKILNYKYDEIMLVDDTFTTLTEASTKGFATKHISEFLLE